MRKRPERNLEQFVATVVEAASLRHVINYYGLSESVAQPLRLLLRRLEAELYA